MFSIKTLFLCVFSPQIPCSGLHFEYRLLQIKHLSRYASEKHMYLRTQRCVQIFSQTNVHMMPAPRSPHMLTACVWPAGRAAQPGCPRGQAAPEHAGGPPASPEKLTGVSPPEAAQAFPPPPGLGPRSQHPGCPAPGRARRWGRGGRGPGDTSERLQVCLSF